MNQWISVEQKYPGIGTKVLVWFGDEPEPYMDVWRYDGKNQYFTPLKKKAAPHQCVTHWQPLPDPPEKP